MQDRQTRIYAFDYLRVTMTILILFFHASLTYIVTDLGVVWPFKDPYGTSLVFDVLIAFIACLVMPVFFLISGFMASSLSATQGLIPMLKNRLHRIGYPFLVSLPILYPLTAIACLYLRLAIAGNQSPFMQALYQFRADEFEWRLFSPMHLWFLYYLFLFCLITAGAGTLLKRIIPELTSSLKNTFAIIYGTKASPLLFALVSFVLLMLRKQNAIETPGTFGINFIVLMSFALFFGFGWMLYYERERFTHFTKSYLFYLIVGYLFFNIKLAFFGVPVLNKSKWADIALAASNALAVWFLIYGLIGLFLRYFNQYSARGSYLSGASYWVYLVHFPLVFFFQAVFIKVNLNVHIKFLLVVGISLSITMLTYHYLVRNTFIGRFLNGGKPNPRISQSPG